MQTKEILSKFVDIAENPQKQKENYLACGKKLY